MTLMQVEKRVKALEKTMRRLVGSKPMVNRKWYRTQAGRFSRDPAFDEIVKLGHTYRKSLRPQVKAYAKLHELLDDFTSRPIVDSDETCAAKFDLLVHARTRVGTMDLEIAATAISHDARVVA